MALFFESMVPELVALAAIFSAALYFYFTRNFNFWRKYNVPHVEPTPFFGNMKDVFFQKLGISEHLKNIYELHRDKPYVGIIAFDRPALILNDLDLVKKVMVKDAHHFVNHMIAIKDNVDPVLSRIVFTLKDEKWRQTRANVTQVFTTSKLKKMIHLVVNCMQELGTYMDSVAVNGAPIDVMETMCMYTTDVTSSCAFGIESNSLKNPNAEIWANHRKILKFSVLKGCAGLLMFFAPNFQNMLRLKFVSGEYTELLRRIIWSAVDYREKNGVGRPDAVSCMIDMKKKGRDINQNETAAPMKIDGDDFVGITFSFLFAGFEMTASTLTYALYELAFKTEIQDRLRAEITEVLDKHDQQVTYESIQQMTYLEMVVSETLRKYPILGFLDRACLKDYELPHPSGKGTFTVPAGTGVYIPLLGIQRDAKYYPDPETFNPENFSEENKQARHNQAFLPFGDGPRQCIGLRFGYIQIKSGLINILTRYEVAPCEKTPVPLRFDPKSFLLQPLDTVYLKFNRISV